MKRIVFILLIFSFNNSFSQTAFIDYFQKWIHTNHSGCGPSSVCAFGPDVQTFSNLPHKGIRGCQSWDDRGVTLSARNMDNGNWERGDAYSISYPFTQGTSYRITIQTLVEGPNGLDDGADGNARPYLQVQLTNNPEMYSDQLCTVSATPIDISNTTNPFIAFHVTDPVIRVQTLTTDFYADQCYSSILFNCYPDMAVPSAGAYHLRELTIEPLGSPYEVTGVSNFCTGSQTYTLNGQTNNISNITWTVDNNGVATVTPGTTTATVTQTGDGFTRLTANWTNACGVPMSAWKNLTIGKPLSTSSDWVMINDENIQYGNGATIDMKRFNTYGFQMISDNANDFNWIVSSNLKVVNPSFASAGIYAGGAEGSKYTIYIEPKNECGTNTGITLTGKILSPIGDDFMVSPNPASSMISIAGAKNNTGDIQEIRMTDKMGTVKKVIKGGKGVKNTNLNISDLPADTYFIQIYNGVKWTNKPLTKVK